MQQSAVVQANAVMHAQVSPSNINFQPLRTKVAKIIKTSILKLKLDRNIGIFSVPTQKSVKYRFEEISECTLMLGFGVLSQILVVDKSFDVPGYEACN